MAEIFIAEEELDYLTDVPQAVAEESEKSFEEEAKDCITLEEFSKLWSESINRLIPQ